jgi:Cft2 family RNA processing exonuclease
MQEVLKILYEAEIHKSLPHVPIFATGLGIALVDYFDTITRKTGLVQFQRKILQEMRVKKLNKNLIPGKSPSPPALYVLSSGMLVENTPSYKAAAALLENHRNAILFCGYCDPDTPGGKLLKTQPGESFDFEALDYRGEVRAEIAQLDLSGHADREELLEFALAIQPRNLVLTHGDPEARRWFKNAFEELELASRVIDMEPLRPYSLD